MAKTYLPAALLPLLLACSGLSGGGNQAASGALDTITAPQSIPGAPAGETATKFDPDDTREFGFVETSHQVSRQGDAFATAFQGFVRHLEKTPTSGGKFEAVPCCEGRWLLVRDATHKTCAAAAIGSEGAWSASVSAGDLLLPHFDFYLGNTGFAPAAAIAGDCSNVNFEDWSKFPIGYLPLPPPPGPAAFVTDNDAANNDIQSPANSGIRSVAPVNSITTLPLLDTADFSRFHFQLPPPGGDDSNP